MPRAGRPITSARSAVTNHGEARGGAAPYFGCPDPKCRTVVEADRRRAAGRPIDTGVECEKCGKPMTVTEDGLRGPFLSRPPATRGAGTPSRCRRN